MNKKTTTLEEYQAKLNALDLQSIRPLRAMMIGTGTKEDVKILKHLEEQTVKIREKIKDLQL